MNSKKQQLKRYEGFIKRYEADPEINKRIKEIIEGDIIEGLEWYRDNNMELTIMMLGGALLAIEKYKEELVKN
jgi:hypothetical protein